MRRLRVVRGLATLLLVGAAGSARAETRVAQLTPRVTPPATLEVVERFQVALAQSLERGRGLTVVPLAEVRLAQSQPDLLACNAAGCLQRLASLLMATRLLAIDVRVVGKAYAVTVRVFDELGREVGRAERHCEICTLSEAEQTIARIGAEVELKLATAPPPPVRPPATLPGTPPTPATAPSTAPWVSPTPPVPPPPPKPTLGSRARGWNWKVIGFVAAGVAVVGIATGAPLAAFGGDPTCDLPEPRKTCPRVYATTGGGATLLTFGLLAAATSGTSFYLHYRWRGTRVEVTPTPTPRGGAVSARLEF
ncbi:MAG: hypothetical protein HY906_19120 [Deltaproteobacteria bacterium]|nr:hypothetical protein [Deltaproteobacteria bacterium]